MWSAAAEAQSPQRLTLQDAEALALQRNPRIRSGEYTAMAAAADVGGVRSAYFPTLYTNVTGAESMAGTRIAAGGLNNPTILDRFAYGVSTLQLVTDFGRTPDLVASASYRADAQEKEVANRRAVVILEVDRAYYNALQAVAVRRIAEQTVSARQIVVDQTTALMNSGLKSSLDLSFAKVSLGEAQLLLVQADNGVQASNAVLSEVLGEPRPTSFELVDDQTISSPPDSADPLIDEALQRRPDVARERLAQQSAAKLADAEHALRLPTVSLAAAAGLTPYHESGINDHYAAVGMNMSIPVFTGGLYSARREAASSRALAQQEAVQELEHAVASDVRVAWLDARTAQQTMTLMADLRTEANDALTLAQQRYNLGLSSIVELTQAQLNLTRAQIEEVNARYQYRSRLAVLDFQTGARQ
jgi:outer membrane protein